MIKKRDTVPAIWSPYLACDKSRLEAVQHKFLRYLAFKDGRPMHPHDHNYSSIMNRFKIPTLASQRKVNDAVFMFKLVRGGVDCPDLTDKLVQRSLPYNLRHFRQFEEATFSSSRALFAQIPRLISTWHELPVHISTSDSLSMFKRLVKTEYYRFE